MLGKLSVPGRPTSLADSRTRAYCACSRCWWGLFGHFFSHLSFLSPFLWETARYRLKYCLKGPLNPKQPTNQPMRNSLLVLICHDTHITLSFAVGPDQLVMTRPYFERDFERDSSSDREKLFPFIKTAENMERYPFIIRFKFF